MAITIGQLAAALRLTACEEPQEPQLSILTRLHGVGVAFVELLGSSAPTAIQDEAIIRLSAYIYDQPLGRGQTYANAWVNSGAGSLVARWTTRRLPE